MAPAPTKAPFWRAFGAAVVLYAVPVSISYVVVASGYGLVGRLIVIAFTFGLLALKFPRAAAIVLVVFSVVGIVGDIRLALDHHVWYVLLVPLHIAAIVYGVSAVRLASAYLSDKKRAGRTSSKRQMARRRDEMAREYDRNLPW